MSESDFDPQPQPQRADLTFKFVPRVKHQVLPQRTVLRVYPNGLVHMEVISAAERYALSVADNMEIAPEGLVQLLGVSLSLIGDLRARVARLEGDLEELRRAGSAP